jgi:O-glycosyl hydrolase
MIGALWSPPHWMKITTGRLMNWDGQSAYDPIIPWGDYGHNTGGGRVNPTMWTDWARYVLSTVKVFEQRAGLPMYAFSFQNEPNVPATYNSATFPYIANDVNNPSAGFTDNHWELYGDGLQALANERALHPEIATKFFGPELSQLGGGASNPYNLPSYNSVRQNLISRGLLDDLGGWATHEYTYPADSAAMWDAWYNGSAHAANIVSGGTSNVLGWLWPQPGIAGDNKEIWQTETDGENQTWTKDGAMGFGLKIYNALVYGNVGGYTSWNLTGYSSSDSWGVVDLDDINNPTNSFKYDAFKQFSRWIRPGAQRINATFENGKASIGGANELDTYNGLNVAAFKHSADQRLTMVMVNMKTTSESTTITIPAGMNISSFQVYQTTGTQKYVQLADLTPSGGQITLTVPASGMVTITGSYLIPTLPAPWAANDIGSPSPTGSSTFDAGTNTFTVAGGGNDIWNNADQFQFLSQDFTGSGSIVARVTSVQNTNTWAKGGVMFRDSTAAGAMFADCVVTPSSGVSFQWRNSTGGNCGYVQIGGVTAPKWVKLVRSGNSFSGYYATTTGTPTTSDWIQVGTAQTIGMSNSAKVGLAVTSHNNGTLSTSTFTGVQINQAPAASAAAGATPTPVTGTNTSLSAMGADDGGEPNLKYTWAATGMPPAPVAFSINATNAAKSTVATFSKAGIYNFQVTITDTDGLAVTSSVAVTVNQTPTTITVTPDGMTLSGGSSQQYAASAADQFGQSIASPSFSWSATGGTIASGLYTAGQIGGNFSVTAASGAANGSASLSIVPTIYSGSGGADQYYLKLSGSTLNLWLGDGTGSPTYSIASNAVSSLVFNGSDGDDTLIVDCSAGNVIPAGGISCDGGNGTDALKLIGTSGKDAVTASASSVSLTRTINTPNVENRSFAGGAGQDSLAITGGNWNFDSDTILTLLTLSNSASAIVTGGATRYLQLSGLAIDSTSTLDLRDKALIVRGGDIGSWDGSAYTGITRLVASGRNGGAWNGSGILTSVPSPGSQLTTLAVATAGSVAKTTFAGVSVSATDVLVMYTYGGDGNLDGQINILDYVRIDQGIASGLAGWDNGDFSYDGSVNILDYAQVIDSNIGNQNGFVFPSASGVAGAASIASAAINDPLALQLNYRGGISGTSRDSIDASDILFQGDRDAPLPSL